MLNACTTLFRGAGYDAFTDGAPSGGEHAAIAAPYAHVTAPLRRLADRYAGEICVALSAGEPVPQWVLDALDHLPSEMQDSSRRSSKYERGIVDLVEAMVLASRIGQEFTGLLIDVDPDRKGPAAAARAGGGGQGEGRPAATRSGDPGRPGRRRPDQGQGRLPDLLVPADRACRDPRKDSRQARSVNQRSAGDQSRP